MELWYQKRYAPETTRHVSYHVQRSSGKNEGLVEGREADLLGKHAGGGRQLTEIKDIVGVVDKDQFGAIMDVLQAPDESGNKAFDKAKYVFTKEEGAIANLEFLADQMSRQALAGKLSVEVFNSSGKSETVRTPTRARALLAELKSQQ
jgi:hypothetical protein